MAINNHIKIPALPSIYSKNKDLSRKIDVFYSLPENGVNEDTGVLMYICGFRAHAEANVFKKLRNNFADEYNLITVQCNYFGYEFMQKPQKLRPQDKHMDYFTKDELIKIYKRGDFHIDEFIELAEKYPVKMLLREDLNDECPENFNEMGIMQAIDNLNALITVMKKVASMGYKFNSKKIILFGNSQGAYLSYLCNMLAPDLISLIIDNSSWLYPEHLAKDKRVLTLTPGKATLKIVFDYKARDIIDDFQILDLKKMYSQFENKARIISFHGEGDHLISLEDKINFLSDINNSEISPITNETLGTYPSDVFSNSNHGLGAHFLNLFKYVCENYNLNFDKDLEFNIPRNNYLETNKYRYIFDYTGSMPVIAKCEKHR